MTYNHTQWMADTGDLGHTMSGIGDLLRSAEPYLKAVGAGETQMTGNRQLAERCTQSGRQLGETAKGWDATYQDLNRAVTRTGGDRAEKKNYAQ
jgi:hypothetical protein